MKTKIFQIEHIGDVSITRRKGSSRISLRVKPNGLVSVNIPWLATEKEAFKFVQQNMDWINRQQKLLEKHKQYFGINQEVNTKFHRISIVSVEQGKVRAVLKNKEVVITIPNDLDVTEDRIQAFIRKVIIEVCRKDAKNYLPQRAKQLALEHGFKFEKVFLKNLKSKWGSCSSNKNINLNVHLMRLPEHLIDFIILHELTHTEHMNHGPHFWERLNMVTNGKARLLDKEMKSMSKLILKE